MRTFLVVLLLCLSAGAVWLVRRPGGAAAAPSTEGVAAVAEAGSSSGADGGGAGAATQASAPVPAGAALGPDVAAEAPPPPPSAGSAPSPRALDGWLAFDESMRASEFELVYHRAGEETERPLQLTSEGRFFVLRLDPGRIDVVAKVRDGQQLAGTVTNVEVPALGGQQDPRLNPFDVRAVRRFTIKVVDERGQPFEKPIGYFTIAPGAKAAQAFDEDAPRGRISFLGRHPEYRIVVWSTGYATTDAIVRGGETVVLRPTAQVRVELTVADDARRFGIPQPAMYRIDERGKPKRILDFAAISKQGMTAEDAPLALVAHREVDQAAGVARTTFAVTRPGRYQVGWTLMRSGVRGKRYYQQEGLGPIIEVGATGEQTVPIAVTKKDLRLPPMPNKSNKPAGKIESPGEGGSAGTPGREAGSGRSG